MAQDGFCAIVTGSASGLGAATAEILAKGGARIVVNYSNSKAEAEKTAELCRKAGAAEVVVVQGDVARDEDCRKIVAAAQGWGRLDALVNNAGTTKHVAHDKLDELSAEDFQRIYAVNTIGPFQMIRAGLAAEIGGLLGFLLAVGIVDDDLATAPGQNGSGRRTQSRSRPRHDRVQTILGHSFSSCCFEPPNVAGALAYRAAKGETPLSGIGTPHAAPASAHTETPCQGGGFSPSSGARTDGPRK